MADGAPIAPGSGLGVATDEVAFALTGTVAKAGTTAVTGTGTAFLSELSIGQVIRIPGTANEDRIISAIASDTALTVSVAFTNTASGQTGSKIQHVQFVKLLDATADSIARVPGDTTNGIDVDVTRVQGTVNAGGDVANAATDAGNPMKIGGKATPGTPAGVSSGQRVDAHFDVQGKQGMWIGQKGSSEVISGDAANGLDVDVTRVGGNVTIVGSQPTVTSGTITASGQSVAASVTNYGNFTIAIFGTYATGLNVIFEASPDGGTNYFPIQVQRESDSTPLNAQALTANNLILWSGSAPGFTNVRIRATAWAAPTGTANIIIAPGSMPFEPVVSAIVTPVPSTPVRPAAIAAATSSTTLRAANVNRKGLMICNEGTANLFVDLTGGTASATANSFVLQPNATWTMEIGAFTTGLITGIWAATGGTGAQVTEFS